MNQITTYLDEIDARRSRVVSEPSEPSYSAVSRWIVEAAVTLRELCADGKEAEARALADEIEAFQAAAKIEPATATDGKEVWRLTPACWAEGLIHGPRAGRTFLMHAGATEAEAIARLRKTRLVPFGGFQVERA